MSERVFSSGSIRAAKISSTLLTWNESARKLTTSDAALDWLTNLCLSPDSFWKSSRDHSPGISDVGESGTGLPSIFRFCFSVDLYTGMRVKGRIHVYSL